MSVVDVTKAAGAEWNKLKDKSKYEKIAAQEKQRYELVRFCFFFLFWMSIFGIEFLFMMADSMLFSKRRRIFAIFDVI